MNDAPAGETPIPMVSWRREPPPWSLADLVALAVWTAAIAAFFWDAVTLRKALFYFDITEINYPYRDFFASELRQGRFSFWHPGLYNGMPLFSESQAGYLHPLKYLLYPWLETWQAFNLDTILSVWLTGVGTFGWLRRHVGTPGALTGAAVFGLSGFVWAHLIHTSMTNALASVPFVIWATEWAWDRGRLAGIALGGLALAVQIFSGHLQDTLLTALALGVYTVFRAATESTVKARLQVLGVALGVVVLGVALAGVQWVPSKELLDRSPRAGGLDWDDLTYGSWNPELLPTLVVREAYGTRARDTDWMDGFYPYHEMNAYLGLTALALAVIGAGAARDRWVAFWVVLAVVASVLMLGRFTFLFDRAHRIPILGSSRIPVRFHLWLSLAASALAAVGIDRLERSSATGIRLRGVAVLVGVLVIGSIPIMLYVYAPVWTEPGRWIRPYHLARYRWLGRELVVATARSLILGILGLSAIVTARRRRSPRLRDAACWALPLVVIADLLGSHWFDVPTIDPSYWTVPPQSARVLKADPTLIRMMGVAEKSAGEPGYASEPIDFPPVRDTLDWSLPPVWGLLTSTGETPLIPRRITGFAHNVKFEWGRLDLESVTHVVGGPGLRYPFGPPVRAGAALIYKNPGALPRARIVGHPYYCDDEKAAVAALKSFGPSVRDQFVIEDPTRPLDPKAEVGGTARIVREEPDHVVVETETPAPAYLVLGDTFDPGWSATVDGRPAAIRPAWVAFRAVFLRAGRHTVAFHYRPAGWNTGLTLSLVGMVGLVGLLAWPRRLPPTSDAHRTLGGPAGWPRWLVISALALVVVSAFRLDPSGRLRPSTRWTDRVHQFTWGAGIEAMRPPRP